jgi:hypothetical protein
VSDKAQYSPPNPVVSITDITDFKSPVPLVVDFELADMPEGETKFVISKQHPKGIFIKDGKVVPNNSFRKQ